MWPFRRKPEPVEPTPIFSARLQEIYPYFDGVRQRKGDPLYLLRELTSDPAKEIELDYKRIWIDCPETQAAIGRVAAETRRVFGIPMIEAGGLTEAKLVALLVHFLTWTDALKKNSVSGPTSPTVVAPFDEATATPLMSPSSSPETANCSG